MKFEIFNNEKKVHLRLSNECNYCLENDADSFEVPKGCLVNKIICNYYIDAKASKEYVGFKNSSDNISWFFNLNNKSKEVLMNDCQEQAVLYAKVTGCEHQASISPTEYIRALLEEYSLLGYSNREKIMFKDTYDTISDILDKHSKLLINNTYIVRPYKLMVDKNYNYLVGFSKIKNSNKDETVFSSRISRIKRIQIINEKCIFSKEDIKKINKSIKDKGVSYLVGEDIQRITVNLTKDGKNLYNKILQDRPKKTSETTKFDTKSNKFVVQYSFECTLRQAKNYFRRFGKEVEIVAPSKLKNEFINELKASLEIYGYKVSSQ